MYVASPAGWLAGWLSHQLAGILAELLGVLTNFLCAVAVHTGAHMFNYLRFVSVDRESLVNFLPPGINPVDQSVEVYQPSVCTLLPSCALTMRFVLSQDEATALFTTGTKELVLFSRNHIELSCICPHALQAPKLSSFNIIE